MGLDSRDVLASYASGLVAVDLYWLPLGAGGHFVRLNGRLYEALAAWMERRPACDLYHSALQVQVPEGTYVIEQTPVPDLSGKQRGVVAEGAVVPPPAFFRGLAGEYLRGLVRRGDRLVLLLDAARLLSTTERLVLDAASAPGGLLHEPAEAEVAGRV